jgi:hypothetical protein
MPGIFREFLPGAWKGWSPLFIRKQQRPWIEFSPDDGREAPVLVHYFSDRCDPFKTVLPQLIATAGGDEERIFVVESPLSEIVDETIALHRHVAFADQVVFDERQRAFFEAVKLSLAEALAKIERTEVVTIGDDEGDGWNALA